MIYNFIFDRISILNIDIYRFVISLYMKEYLPVIEWDSDDTVFEIDEMYLGAKQRGKHGRRPATNHLVFGNKSY